MNTLMMVILMYSQLNVEKMWSIWMKRRWSHSVSVLHSLTFTSAHISKKRNQTENCTTLYEVHIKWLNWYHFLHIWAIKHFVYTKGKKTVYLLNSFYLFMKTPKRKTMTCFPYSVLFASSHTNRWTFEDFMQDTFFFEPKSVSLSLLAEIK